MFNQDNKNLILAMGLSMAVLIGWNYFYGAPQLERTRQTQTHAQGQNPTAAPAGQPAATQAAPGSPAAPRPAAPTALKTRAEALKGPRVRIDTPSLVGSLSLVGGRIDDVSLKGYRETTDPKSPIITLFSPPGTAESYYADFGFAPAPGGAAPDMQAQWTADGDVLTEARPVTLTFENGRGQIFRRKISVDSRFMFTIADSIENKGAEAATFYPYALIARYGIPHISGYAVLHEGLVGVIGESRVQEYTYAAIEKEPRASKTWKGEGGWLGITDKYWASAIIPDQKTPFEGRFSAQGSVAPKTYQTDAIGEARAIAPGATTEVTTRLFAGAKETQTIDAYQSSLGIKNFDLMIDWGWFYFLTKPLFRLIDLIYHFVGNFGVAILIVTLLVKGLFFPLANRSYQSMAKMKAVQPQLTELRERYKDDRAAQQREMMEIYKREKINPVSGCLPIVLQIPVFFALYKVIFITIEMRHAPFFGWIKDLSGPDPTNIFNLFGLLPFDPTTLPVFGPFLHLGVWPLIMGLTMFIQMKMNPEPTDPVQKTMFAWMPVIFTFMLGSFPSGLVIYWTWNNLLSVLQQGYIMKKAGVKLELWDNLRGLFGAKAAPGK